MHYLDTLEKGKDAKKRYLKGERICDLAKRYHVHYITIWRWLQMTGISESEKNLHKEQEVKNA